MKDKSDDYWKQKLTPQQYHILREKGTEMPFTGSLLREKGTGMYVCAACGQQLFRSDRKFDSKSGWPSFDDVIESAVELHEDRSHGMVRTEVTCANCGSHLGHVFDDGPRDTTGQRYCINSLALNFEKNDKKAK